MIFYLLQSPLDFLVYIVALLAALTIHEFSHAWAASILGDDTAKAYGRLSLNPLAHLDPWGTLFLFFAGFGWGKPVIYNPNNLKYGRTGEFLVAIAGPFSNIILAFLFSVPFRIIHTVNPALEGNLIFSILDKLALINLILATFNMIPIPPLDGSKILYLFISEETKITLERIGPLILFGLLFLIFFSGGTVWEKTIVPIVEWLKWLVKYWPG